ncbi:YARHG domain-containing protein [Haliangium sp.]|uniref:YARHG domain-containing protein n=1 Tax=Haliangium sp. TaxID=2663208 RepID=UPI003D119A0F
MNRITTWLLGLLVLATACSDKRGDAPPEPSADQAHPTAPSPPSPPPSEQPRPDRGAGPQGAVSGDFLDAPSVLDAEFSDAQLGQLTRLELHLLRNAVYARHGRPFKSKLLTDYFGTKPWYQPNSAYTDAALTSVDERNVGRIKTHERAFGGPLTQGEHGQALTTGETARAALPPASAAAVAEACDPSGLWTMDWHPTDGVNREATNLLDPPLAVAIARAGDAYSVQAKIYNGPGDPELTLLSVQSDAHGRCDLRFQLDLELRREEEDGMSRADSYIFRVVGSPGAYTLTGWGREVETWEGDKPNTIEYSIGGSTTRS